MYTHTHMYTHILSCLSQIQKSHNMNSSQHIKHTGSSSPALFRIKKMQIDGLFFSHFGKNRKQKIVEKCTYCLLCSHRKSGRDTTTTRTKAAPARRATRCTGRLPSVRASPSCADSEQQTGRSLFITCCFQSRSAPSRAQRANVKQATVMEMELFVFARLPSFC